jgi:hypothetical protein
MLFSNRAGLVCDIHLAVRTCILTRTRACYCMIIMPHNMDNVVVICTMPSILESYFGLVLEEFASIATYIQRH